jgi:hypothetical protein
MSNDNWQEPNIELAARVDQPPLSPRRLVLERLGIGIVAFIALALPIMIGLMFYLAVSDGIDINGGDPLHGARLWMVQERRGATGLGLTITSPSDKKGTLQCAYTNVIFLKWNQSLSLETNAGYCRCYEQTGSEWTESPSGTCQ